MSTRRPIPMPFQMELFAPARVIIEAVQPAIESRRRGPRHQPKGEVYDLVRFFEIINEVMFKNELPPPVMRWSRNRWRYTLGLCDVEGRIITMNCALDDARVPEVVLAGVLHHEMLHLYFGFSENARGQRRFHTPDFRNAERLFPGFATTEKWVAENWPLRGRPAKKSRPVDGSFLTYLAVMRG